MNAKQKAAATDNTAPKKKPGELERLFGFLKFFKKRKKMWMTIGGISFLALIIWWGVQPIKGPMEYGVCKVFASRLVKYPQTIRMVSAYINIPVISIVYSYIDPYGNYKSERLDCNFIYDDYGNFRMHSAVIIKNKREQVPQELVDQFNPTIPGVILAEPDLVMPGGVGETLRSLKTF